MHNRKLRIIGRRPGDPETIEKDILIRVPAETVCPVITEPAQSALGFAGATDLDPVPGGQGGLTFADRATSRQMSVSLTVQAGDPPHRYHEAHAKGWDAHLARLQGYAAVQP